MKKTALILVGIQLLAMAHFAAAQSNIVTGAEALVVDTVSNSTASKVVDSWISWDSAGDPGTGQSVGASIAAPAPFIITRAEFLVNFTNAAAFANTEFQAGIFRNTNDFLNSLEIQPAIVKAEPLDGSGDITVTQVAPTQWIIGVTMPQYVWAANRILTIRTVALDNTQPFAQGQWVMNNSSPLNEATYAVSWNGVNTDTNNPPIPLNTVAGCPAMRLWTEPVVSVGVTMTAFDPFSFTLTYVPGVLFGHAQNMNGPWCWNKTDQIGKTFADANDSSGFFKVVPDTQ